MKYPVFLRFMLLATIFFLFYMIKQSNLSSPSNPYCTLKDFESLEGEWLPGAVWQPPCDTTPTHNRVCNQSNSDYVVPVISNCRLRDLSLSLVACAKGITDHRKYTLAGDSLSGQSKEALEIAGLSSLHSFESALPFPYLRHVGKVAYFIEDIGVALHERVEHYIATATPDDVLIYNSGAWWSLSALRTEELFANDPLKRHDLSQPENEPPIIDLYKRSLILLAKTMKEAGLTLIFRATYPAIHISEAPPNWGRHLYISFNRIMKQIAKDFDVVYVDIGNLLNREDIQLHVLDNLHYCIAYVDPENSQNPCRWSSAFHLFQRVYMHLMIEIEQTIFKSDLPLSCRILID